MSYPSKIAIAQNKKDSLSYYPSALFAFPFMFASLPIFNRYDSATDGLQRDKVLYNVSFGLGSVLSATLAYKLGSYVHKKLSQPAKTVIHR